MSHFTVMVFGDNPQDQLAPYDENLEGVENPKWDWYSLGGRWTGYFKVKDENKIVLGTPGVFKNEAKKMYSDVVLKKDIDIDGMRNDYIDEVLEEYHAIISIVQKWIDDNTIDGVKPIPKPYSYYAKMIEDDGITIDEARQLYQKTETYYKDLLNVGYVFFTDSPIDDYWKLTEEEFIEKSLKHFMIPFAYIKNGEWIAKGEMGWFGISYDEIDYEMYKTMFWNDFNSLPDHTLITLWDCHI